tara:strand:- start:1836 stop:2108 length:273 start_codon:yes stop_codon:yes gene_type:complete
LDNTKVYGYKVRNTRTGLYLRGGSNTVESRVGRVWANRSSAIRAINMKLKYAKYADDPFEYKKNILSYEVVELVEGCSKPIHFYIDDINF